MSLLIFLLFGAVVGWLASVLMGSGGHGLVIDILLGVVGAVVGGWVMNYFGKAGVTGFDVYSVVVGVIGASILIFLSRLF